MLITVMRHVTHSLCFNYITLELGTNYHNVNWPLQSMHEIDEQVQLAFI